MRRILPLVVILLAGCSSAPVRDWYSAGCVSAGDAEDHLILCGNGDRDRIDHNELEGTEFTCTVEWKRLGIRAYYDETDDCGPFMVSFERVLPTLNGTLTWRMEGDPWGMACSLRLDRPDGTFLAARGSCLTSEGVH